MQNQYIMAGLLFTVVATAAACSTESPKAMDTSTSQTQTHCPAFESKDWVAWLNKMPGPDGPRLHVSGKIVLPTPGYNIEILPGPLDRRQPPAQRLRLKITPPSGMVAQVITTREVKASFPAQASNYRAVIISCGDKVLAEITDVETAY